MKKIAISQSSYIPWKGYFDMINMVDEFIIYDDMQYTKQDWRNRNKIKTRDGIQWLTIKVEDKELSQKIRETKISFAGWGAKHWKTIEHSYSKSPFFKNYKQIFEDIYLHTEDKYLSEINYKFIVAVCNILNIKTKLIWSDDFELAEDRNERLINICKQRETTDYFTGPSAKDYMNVQLFQEANINVHFIDYSGYPEYQQLFGGFEHGVTVLDLIFNTGPDSSQYMKSFAMSSSNAIV